MAIRTYYPNPNLQLVIGDLNTENVLTTSHEFWNVLVGGNRNDTFYVQTDRLLDEVIGGNGRDLVDFSGSGGLRIDLASGSVQEFLTQGDVMVDEQPEPAWQTVAFLTGIEDVRGTFFSDTIVGNWADNTIEGGFGADGINGGLGNDTASYEHSFAGVTVNLGGQPGGLLGNAGYGFGGDAEGDVLISIENLVGSSHGDVFYGNDANNTFDGGAGLDRVSYRYAHEGVTVDLQSGTVAGGASTGTDTLVNVEYVEGSRFNDTFQASTRSDTFVFGSTIGHDTVDNFDARNSNANHDLISFEGVFESWDELSQHIDRDGDDWTITIDGHNSITLTDVRGTLDANDFDFG
jgi:hypothetical protein